MLSSSYSNYLSRLSFTTGIVAILLKNNTQQFSLFILQEHIIFLEKKQVIIAVYNDKNVTFMHKFKITIYI